MTLVDDYLKLYENYKIKYGNKFVLFYQVGSFFECYSLKDDYLEPISDICRLIITKKNKKITDITIKNPKMIGIPVDQITKFTQILLNSKYTVIVHAQIPSLTVSDQFERNLTAIYSPGTVINGDNTTLDNWLMVILIENDIISISLTDLSVGTIKLYYYSSEIFENTYKLILKFKPSEIVIYNTSKIIKNDVFKALELKEAFYYTEIDKQINKVNYQNEFLKKIFTSDLQSLSTIEYLDLEHYNNLVIVLILLINYIHDHDKNNIKNLSKPEILVNNDNKTELYGDIDLLDIENDNSHNLFNIINFTSTNMGKRLLRERLMNPIYNIEELNNRYNKIEKTIEFKDEFIKILKNITDIEKLHRKFGLCILKPNEFYILHNNYVQIKELFILLINKKYEIDKEFYKNFIDFMIEYQQIFNINELNNDDSCFFNHNEELMQLQEKINEKLKFMNDFKNELSDMIDPKKECVKLVISEDFTFYSMTTLRSNKISKSKKIKYDLKYTKLKNVCKISFDELQEISDEYFTYKKEFDKKIKELYLEYLDTCYKKYISLFTYLNHLVADIDVTVSNAICSCKYSYTKPIINSKSNDITIIEGRHPIVERINDNKFISNDLVLNDKNNGILVYGINSSGKSIFLKQTGLIVLLAQSGMFVPCKEMKYNPFKKIMSKILNRDDILKGKSTFISELENIRNMLSKSDKNTLILSDELSAGTERYSAVSLVSSCINELKNKNSKFIFSSHFHDIIEHIDKNILVKHFKVIVNDNKIILDRKLEDGPSEKLYGLEIAKVLGLDSSVIEKAYKIRNILIKKEPILSTKISKYNKDLYINECSICKSKEDLHVHHIIEQKNADKDGKIDGVNHKNVKNNLAVLCEQCHIKVHQNKIIIYGYIDTINGLEFKYELLK